MSYHEYRSLSTIIEQRTPKVVEIVAEFSKLGEIDTMNEKYFAEFFIEAKWVEEEDIIVYDEKKNWNPKLYIENALHINKEEIKYSISKDEKNNTVVRELRQIKGSFWERLELENFPFDIQELSIVITSKLSLNELEIIPNSKNLSYISFNAKNTFTDQQKWSLFKMVKVNQDRNDESNDQIDQMNKILNSKILFKNPKFSATCYCTRKPGYYLFNAYFLIFLITVSSLTVFSVDPKLPHNRLPTAFTLLLTSISFKWVINRSLPAVSHLTSLDKYAIVCILFLCLTCVWHSLVGSIWPTNINLDLLFFAIFVLIFILIHVGLIIWTILAYRNIWKLMRLEKEFLNEFKNNIETEKLKAIEKV